MFQIVYTTASNRRDDFTDDKLLLGLLFADKKTIKKMFRVLSAGQQEMENKKERKGEKKKLIRVGT